MSSLAISSVSSPSVASMTTESHGLQKTANGEYTAQSVEANPAQAVGMIKMKDGNYGVPIVAAADRYTGLATDLTTLKLGG